MHVQAGRSTTTSSSSSGNGRAAFAVFVEADFEAGTSSSTRSSGAATATGTAVVARSELDSLDAAGSVSFTYTKVHYNKKCALMYTYLLIDRHIYLCQQYLYIYMYIYILRCSRPCARVQL
jgi:hypothetical protein